MCEISKNVNLDEKGGLEREIYRNMLKKCLTEICKEFRSKKTEYTLGGIVAALMVTNTVIKTFEEHIPNAKEVRRRIDEALISGSIKELYCEDILKYSMLDNQNSKIDLLIIDLEKLVEQL